MNTVLNVLQDFRNEALKGLRQVNEALEHEKDVDIIRELELQQQKYEGKALAYTTAVALIESDKLAEYK